MASIDESWRYELATNKIGLAEPQTQNRSKPYRATPKPYRTTAFRAPVRESLGTAIQLAHLGMATRPEIEGIVQGVS